MYHSHFFFTTSLKTPRTHRETAAIPPTKRQASPPQRYPGGIIEMNFLGPFVNHDSLPEP